MSNVDKFESSTFLPLNFEDKEEELRTLLFMRLCKENNETIGKAIELITQNTDSMDLAAIASVIWLNALAMRIMELYSEKIEDPERGTYKIAPRPEVVDELIEIVRSYSKEKLLGGIVKTMLTMFTVENARAIIVTFLEGNRDFIVSSELTFNVPMTPPDDSRTSSDLIDQIAEESRRKAEESSDSDIQFILKQTGTH